MSVTESYKTFKLSACDDAIQYIVVAVLTQLRADRAQIARFPATGFDDFLVQQIATGTAALNALNVTSTREDTHGALEGAMLQTVVNELRAMRTLMCGGHVGAHADRIKRINAALLFLENTK